jgi:hypothetical protein
MLTIRPFHADDLDDLYKISLATGLAGDDASHLYADPRLMGHIYSAPYALLEPQLAFVVEDQEGVAGVRSWHGRYNGLGRETRTDLVAFTTQAIRHAA